MATGLYASGISELDDHLARVQSMATRGKGFQPKEASDPTAFPKSVVEYFSALAEAVAELIKQTGS